MIAYDLLQSIRLLADACASFDEHCARGIEPRPRRDRRAPARLADARHRARAAIGYDKAAKIAKHAHEHGTTLREAAVALGVMTPEAFDAAVKPEDMIGTRKPT